jgi:hypothetical protein
VVSVATAETSQKTRGRSSTAAKASRLRLTVTSSPAPGAFICMTCQYHY